jgi:hypothetical protein
MVVRNIVPNDMPCGELSPEKFPNWQGILFHSYVKCISVHCSNSGNNNDDGRAATAVVLEKRRKHTKHLECYPW